MGAHGRLLWGGGKELGLELGNAEATTGGCEGTAVARERVLRYGWNGRKEPLTWEREALGCPAVVRGSLSQAPRSLEPGSPAGLLPVCT